MSLAAVRFYTNADISTSMSLRFRLGLFLPIMGEERRLGTASGGRGSVRASS
jgi:hypothetical protein